MMPVAPPSADTGTFAEAFGSSGFELPAGGRAGYAEPSAFGGPAMTPVPPRPGEAAETTAAVLLPAAARPVPAWRPWLVPLVLVGAIVITAAALVNRPVTTDDEGATVPPAVTLGPPATGEVTIVPPSGPAASAAPSASAGTLSAAASPSGTGSGPAPTPGRASAAAPAATTRAPAAPNGGSGPITAYSACFSGGIAVFTATFTTAFEWHHAFIDTDGDATTGYDVPDINGRVGADYMVENNSVWESTDTEWGWSEADRTGLQYARSGDTFRWAVPASSIGAPGGPLRVVFNGAGGNPDAYSAVLTTGAC